MLFLFYVVIAPFCFGNVANEINLLEIEDIDDYGNKLDYHYVLDTTNMHINIYMLSYGTKQLCHCWVITSDNSLVYYDSLSGPKKLILRDGLISEEQFVEEPIKWEYVYDKNNRLTRILRKPDIDKKPYWVKKIGIEGYLLTPIVFKWSGNQLEEVINSEDSSADNWNSYVYRLVHCNTVENNIPSPVILSHCADIVNSHWQSYLFMLVGLYGVMPITNNCHIYSDYKGKTKEGYIIEHIINQSNQLEVTIKRKNHQNTLKFRVYDRNIIRLRQILGISDHTESYPS